MLQRSSTGKRKRSGDLDAEVTCHMILQPNEKDEFIQSIKQLYQSESLCDVTFKVGEQLFPAHRIILAAANRSWTFFLLFSHLNLGAQPFSFQRSFDYNCKYLA